MNPSATLSATGRFSLLIEALCRAVAARIAARTMTGELITLIWNRLRRFDESLQALATRIRAGTLRAGNTGPRRFAGRQAAQSLPRGFGWLLPLVPQHAAAGASQLRHLLADPEMAELIAATPRIARTLRPLARMLGLSPDLLPLPPATPRQPPEPVTQRVAAPAHAPEPPTPREPPPPPPPRGNPEAPARAGPDSFLWPWLLPDHA